MGTGTLVRFGLRRERTRLAVWSLAIGGLIAYVAVALPRVYPDAAAFRTRAAIMADPSGAFMTGPGYGLESYSLGVMIANELVGLVAAAAALMSIFVVTRHTRADEETGRAELVRASVVGRHAPLTSALVVLLVADAAVALVLLGALVGTGLPVADSLAVAVGVGLVGLVFGAAAALTSQLAEHARTASGMAGAALGLAYVLRGVGDAQQRGGSTLSWLSPIGWAQQTRAYVDLRWWPLLLDVVLAGVLVAVAAALSLRRDVGAGMLRASAGRADARPALIGPVGLTARLERGTIVGWAAGLLVFAVLTGSMAQAVVDGFREQPQLAELFGRGEDDLLRSTLSAFLSFYAMAVAVFAVVVTNRLAREEAEGRTGAVLATGVSRVRWLAGSLVVTTLASALLLGVAGAGVGIGAGSSVGDPALVGQFAWASLAYLPLVLCFTGLALVAHGLGAGTWWLWTLLVASIVVGLYGPLFDLPQPILDAAPFGLVPAVPDEPALVPLLLMLVAAALLVAVGMAAYRRRDLTA